MRFFLWSFPLFFFIRANFINFDIKWLKPTFIVSTLNDEFEKKTSTQKLVTQIEFAWWFRFENQISC